MWEDDTGANAREVGLVTSQRLFVQDGTLFLNYSSGEVCVHNNVKRSMQIRFECDSAAGIGRPIFELQELESDCLYSFYWATSAACPSSHPPPSSGSHTSGGVVFLIILFTALICYFVGGVLYKRHKGAKGCEQLPNSSIWIACYDFTFVR